MYVTNSRRNTFLGGVMDVWSGGEVGSGRKWVGMAVYGWMDMMSESGHE